MISYNNEEWKDFMNDHGEMRDRPFRIVHTKAIRNPMMERRMVEESRERNLYYLALTGVILIIISMI